MILPGRQQHSRFQSERFTVVLTSSSRTWRVLPHQPTKPEHSDTDKTWMREVCKPRGWIIGISTGFRYKRSSKLLPARARDRMILALSRKQAVTRPADMPIARASRDEERRFTCPLKAHDGLCLAPLGVEAPAAGHLDNLRAGCPVLRLPSQGSCQLRRSPVRSAIGPSPTRPDQRDSIAYGQSQPGRAVT